MSNSLQIQTNTNELFNQKKLIGTDTRNQSRDKFAKSTGQLLSSIYGKMVDKPNSDLITNINMKKILKNMSKVVDKSQKPYKQKNIVKQIPQQRVLITKKQPISTRTSMKTFAQHTVKHSLSNVDKPYYPNHSKTVNLLYKSILKKYPDVGNNKITETDISLILSQLNLPVDMSKWTTQNKITIGNIIKDRIKNPKPEITQQQIQYNPVQFTQDYSEADTRKFEYTV